MKATIGNFLTQSNKDFPLDCETLNYINNNASMIATLGNIAGDKTILTGCTISSGNRSSGYVYLKTTDFPEGEVMYYEGGAAATCYLKKETVSVNANGDTYANAYTIRSLASGIGSEQYNWSAFTTLTTTAALKTALDTLTATVNALSAEPVGVIKLYAGSVAPAHWAFCVGTDYSSTDYSALYGVVGNSYNTAANANGGNWVAPASGRFRIPDLRGRFVVGRNESDTDYNTNGKAGGSKKVALTEAEMPAHKHVNGAYLDDDPVDTLYGVKTGLTSGRRKEGNASSTVSPWTSTVGSGNSHENRPPYYTLSYIIKIE